MSSIKVILVEDGAVDAKECREALDAFNDEKKTNIILETSNGLDDALSKINRSYDAAIVDLKLSSTDVGIYAGNKIVKEIKKNHRIPIIVYSGNTEHLDSDLRKYVTAITKGDGEGYHDVFNKIKEIVDTGITRILGGRGCFEDLLTKIFWDSMPEYINSFISYSKCGHDTEKPLLRSILSQLNEHIDTDHEMYYPEEMYIKPPVNGHIKTGSIVIKDDIFYVVTSPACDLVYRSGAPKTERIHYCEIESFSACGLISKKITEAVTCPKESDPKYADTMKKSESAKEAIRKLELNSYCNYYHYLPKSAFFPGGVINFRKIAALKFTDFKKEFGDPCIQITAPFVKDIISRFSSYYARQGQPEFSLSSILSGS